MLKIPEAILQWGVYLHSLSVVESLFLFLFWLSSVVEGRRACGVSWPPIGSSISLTPWYAWNVLLFCAKSQPARFQVEASCKWEWWSRGIKAKKEKQNTKGTKIEEFPNYLGVEANGSSDWWIFNQSWNAFDFSASCLSDCLRLQKPDAYLVAVFPSALWGAN